MSLSPKHSALHVSKVLLCYIKDLRVYSNMCEEQGSWKARSCCQGLPKQYHKEIALVHQSFIKQWRRRNEAGVGRIGGMWRRACQGHHMACFTLLSPVILPSVRSRYSHIMLQGITAVSSRYGMKIG